jgi:hypothetical protein
MSGQVLLYEGDPKGGWSSWGIVLAKAPGYEGTATATLLGADGDARQLPALHFHDGHAATWLVTYDDLTAYDRLTITSPNGEVVATAPIRAA